MKQNKLHICMMIDTWFPFVGGGQVHVKNIINQLRRHPNIQASLFHSPHHNILLRTLWNIWVVPEVIIKHQQKRFDLIHAHAFSAGLPGKIISLLLNIPIIYTVHGSHLMDKKEISLKSWGERILLTKIKYTYQVSVTQSFTKYPNVNKNISIIRNGVNIKEFNSAKVKKNKHFTLLYVGRSHPTKGIPILKRAFMQIKKNFPDVKLRLITGGKITGKKLVKEYKKAHVFVLPSLVEGQPLVILEAWAAKLPVIATKTSGVKEIAKHNHDAILVKPGNQAQLQNAIIKIIEMKPLERKELAENGYKKVKDQFAWEMIADKLVGVYHKAVTDFNV